MWFDSHCHLHLCDESESVGEVVARARAAGVSAILAVGIDVDSSRQALEIATRHDLVSSAGVHPNSADAWNEDALQQVELLLGHEVVHAVGETGLDFYRDDTPGDVQRSAFRDHIALAKRFDKALVVHTRESTSDALEELELAGPPSRVIFHCWSGRDAELTRALELGAYVSFAGNVSFKSADALRVAAARVPDDRLLVETDAPYLAPVPYRGRPNEPAHVIHVGASVAEARGAAVDEVAARTAANARAALAMAP